MTAAQLSKHARAIWRAGVDAVDSERLVRDVFTLRDDVLTVCGHRFPLDQLGRIAVVGAGKAGAGMAAGVEAALSGELLHRDVTGWINVPADCVRPLRKIHLHAARPPGVNEPTEAGVVGSRKILEIVSELTPSDLCLVLISGGGSALLPAPKSPVTLQEKRAVTQFLMRSGATINELNTVRKRLSEIKGGGLARASNAGCLVSLIISDIVGDPLDLIASGPTYPNATTDADALAVLDKFAAQPPEIPQNILDMLKRQSDAMPLEADIPKHVFSHIIGNNATALRSAADRAERLGYRVVSLGSENCGEADAEGRELAERCRRLRDQREPGGQNICILSGGEPVVHLRQTDRPRKGGRNQQLVLAGLQELVGDGMQGISLLAGGTDGEDGPTDAAGAWADADVLEFARQKDLDAESYLAINDSYHYFEQVGSLLKTGPTHTNVMDLRVALIAE